MRRAAWTTWTLLLALLALLLLPRPAAAQDTERLLVADPYLELHTGPGRGYPVFHVAERHEWVTVEGRRTDWFKVRTQNGTVGWVARAQLAKTLTEAGSEKTFRDTLVDDHLARKVELGVGWGRFNTEPMLKVWTHWRFAEGLGTELTLGQVQGTFSGTEYWHLNLLAEPWSDRRLSPYLAVGLGKFRNIPNASLVQAVPTDANLGNGSVGLRWAISERFMARADWTLHTAFVSDARSLEYRAWTLGLSFFF